MNITVEAIFLDIFAHPLDFLDEATAAKSNCDCKVRIGFQANFVRSFSKAASKLPSFLNKHLLAIDLPFFKSLFFNEFEEKDYDTVEMTYRRQQYLYCVYPPCRPLSLKRMSAILCLADRFQNQAILDAFAAFLLKPFFNGGEMLEIIRITSEY